MSKAKKTKRTKQYSKLHSYRHLTDIFNRVKKIDAGEKPRKRVKQDFLEVINEPPKSHKG